MKIDSINIIPYNDDLKEFVKILNEEWLQKYSVIEESDRVQLGDPQHGFFDAY